MAEGQIVRSRLVISWTDRPKTIFPLVSFMNQMKINMFSDVVISDLKNGTIRCFSILAKHIPTFLTATAFYATEVYDWYARNSVIVSYFRLDSWLGYRNSSVTLCSRELHSPDIHLIGDQIFPTINLRTSYPDGLLSHESPSRFAFHQFRWVITVVRRHTALWFAYGSMTLLQHALWCTCRINNSKEWNRDNEAERVN